jgi:Mn-dependent DtxR family transcriptional regulator
MSLLIIDTLGYGKIYKTIMRNKALLAIAKAIYAYICAYAGNSSKAFPKRDRIIRDLQINKDTFTKHLHALAEGGYLAKERTSHGNLYTIVQSVSAFDIAPVVPTIMSDQLVFENIQAKGFGTVPKLMLFDTRLSAQSKAIYAYFCSFAGAGTAAFPRQTTIMRDMKMSKDAYYSHFNQLINNGYITVEYRKDNGKFTHSIYRLHAEVEISQGVLSEKAGHGGKPLKTSSAMSEILGTGGDVSEKPGSDNLGQANIKNGFISNISFEKEQKVDNHQERS